MCGLDTTYGTYIYVHIHINVERKYEARKNVTLDAPKLYYLSGMDFSLHKSNKSVSYL